jgi:GDP-L-fucose synthase
MPKIYVAGHNGMVGSALCKYLTSIGEEVLTSSRNELDLTNQAQVNDFFSKNEIDQVYLAAAKVGGIYANSTYPADFIYQNIMIQSNVIDAAYRSGIKKLMFLGSSCIYPKLASQPMNETSLLSGLLESTNEPYAIAKIAGIKMCESYNIQYGTDYRSVMPTNLYGYGDNFHPENSHVVPALLRKFHEAKCSSDSSVVVWGSGEVRREFLHVDDMVRATYFVMNLSHEIYLRKIDSSISHINIGTGKDCSIKELSRLIRDIVGFKGEIIFDTSKPDGPPRKLLDVSLIDSLGWSAGINLQDGLKCTYSWFCENQNIRY